MCQCDDFQPKVGYLACWPIPVDQLLHYGVILNGQRLVIHSVRVNYLPWLHSKTLGYTENIGMLPVHKRLAQELIRSSSYPLQ